MRTDAPTVIAVRSVFRQRVWTAIPNYLIEDSQERVITAVLPGARCQSWLPMDKYDDQSVRSKACAALASGRWKLVESTWHTNRALWIWPRGCSYMIGHFWEDVSDRFRGWYLNLQTPLRPSAGGFDLFDYFLDVVVRPDRTWFWKDEEELAEAVRLGVIGRDDATTVRAQGVALSQQIDELLPTGWEEWRPAADWPPLVLPAGWKTIQ